METSRSQCGSPRQAAHFDSRPVMDGGWFMCAILFHISKSIKDRPLLFFLSASIHSLCSSFNFHFHVRFCSYKFCVCLFLSFNTFFSFVLTLLPIPLVSSGAGNLLVQNGQGYICRCGLDPGASGRNERKLPRCHHPTATSRYPPQARFSLVRW